MRIGAQWIYDKEGFEGGEEPTWLAIGWVTADPGGVLLLAGLIAGWRRRPPPRRRQGLRPAQGDDGDLSRPAGRLRGRRLGDVRQAGLGTRSSARQPGGRRPALPAGRPAAVECTQRQGKGAVGETAGSTRARTTTGSTPGSPRSAVRYRARRSPCGTPCSAHHGTFGGGVQVGSVKELRGTCPSPTR